MTIRETAEPSPYELVARALAEPLRRAFDAHVDEHRCGDHHPGIAYCPEGKRLFDLMPWGDSYGSLIG